MCSGPDVLHCIQRPSRPSRGRGKITSHLAFSGQPNTYHANSCRKSHGRGQPLRSTASVTRQRHAKASGCASSTRPNTRRDAVVKCGAPLRTTVSSKMDLQKLRFRQADLFQHFFVDVAKASVWVGFLCQSQLSQECLQYQYYGGSTWGETWGQ